MPSRGFWREASHDLRQPLQAAALLARALRQPVPGDAGRTARDVEELVRVIERMALLLTDIAHLTATLEERRRPVHLPVQVSAACRDALLVTMPLAEDRGITIAADIRDVAMSADPRWLAAAVEGLLLAALRHDRGGVISLAVSLRREAVRFEIAWRGPLPNGRAMASVFVEEPRRLGEQPPVHGVGLGLVAEIARLMGWRLAVTTLADGRRRIALACPAAVVRPSGS